MQNPSNLLTAFMLTAVGEMKKHPEDPKPKVTSGMPGAYYAALKPRTDGVWKPVLPRLSEEEKVQQRKHLARKRLIKEIVECLQKV